MRTIQALTTDRKTISTFQALEQDTERLALELARAQYAQEEDLAQALVNAWTTLCERAKDELAPDERGLGRYPRAGYGLGAEELAQALALLESAHARALDEERARLDEAGEDLAPCLFRSASGGRGALYGSSDDSAWTIEEANEYTSADLRERAPKAPSCEDLAQALAHGQALAYAPGAERGSARGARGRSNCRALDELVQGAGPLARAWTQSGSHGTYGLAVDFLARSAELSSALIGLGNYPVVDEELMCEMEREEEQTFLEQERGSFERALESVLSDRYGGLDFSGALDLVKAEDVEALFWSLEPQFEHSQEGAWTDVEALAEHAETDDIEALPGFAAPAELLDEVRRASVVVRAARAACLDVNPPADGAPSAELLARACTTLQAEERLRACMRRPGEELAPGQGLTDLERIFLQLADPRLPELLATRRAHYLDVLATWWRNLSGEDLSDLPEGAPRKDLAQALRPAPEAPKPSA